MQAHSLSKTARTLGVLGGLVIILLLVAANWLAFRYLAHTDYFLWYIENGTLIGVLAGFVALIWEGLSARDDLLSAHPGYYLLGCLALMSAFYWSLACHLERRIGTKPAAKPEFSFPLDGPLGLIMLVVIAVLGLAWVLVVAPLNYVVTLLTGSVARRQLAGSTRRAVAVQYEGQAVPVYMSLAQDEELPPYGATEITLAAKPFEVTQALTALVLFIAKIIAGV